MTELPERIDSKIDRSGTHHVWTGAKNARGVGLVSIEGKITTVRRVVWEAARGPLSEDINVIGCADDPACVRLDHLSLPSGRSTAAAKSSADKHARATAGPGRGRKGGGSLRRLRAHVWELTVTAGRYADGTPRRVYKTVSADTEQEAARQLAAFVTEVQASQLAEARELRDLSVDDAIERFLTEHLIQEKGREDKTVNDYRNLHRRWFSPTIGRRRVSRIDTATMDRLFGKMRAAGLSRSRLNQAKSLYAPFFRWAKRRGMVLADPMLGFELPTSTHVARERTPPEVEQLCLLLATAVEVVPDVAPLLLLGAVTGMRRGELVAVRRSRIDWNAGRITVDAAVTERGRVKGTKTRRERSFFVDPETLAMLRRHCDEMDARAELAGVAVGPDAFLFSQAFDCSVPLAPDAVTKRVAVLKQHLGIEDKGPDTVALEDEALRLFRSKPIARPTGMTGPATKGGMSYREIGERLGRTDRWAMLAVQAAERREAAEQKAQGQRFDGSILGLRKFTSTELLDAGFNISMVAERQGHGPQVLAKHYAKTRRSADQRAAEHLGRVVHRKPPS